MIEMDKLNIIQWIQRDKWYLLVMLLCIFAMVWTAASAGDYADDCNRHWESQLAICGCKAIGEQFNGSFSYALPLQHLNLSGGE